MAPLNFCPVCRIHHDKVKGHKYGVKHKKYLTEFLSKARKKLQDVRLSMKEVTTLQDEDRDRSKFWCAFCEQEIDEKKSVFVRYVGDFFTAMLSLTYLEVEGIEACWRILRQF